MSNVSSPTPTKLTAPEVVQTSLARSAMRGALGTSELLSAARALDDGRPVEARQHLHSFPLAPCSRQERIVAIALWKRLLAADGKIDQREQDIASAMAAM